MLKIAYQHGRLTFTFFSQAERTTTESGLARKKKKVQYVREIKMAVTDWEADVNWTIFRIDESGGFFSSFSFLLHAANNDSQ